VIIPISNTKISASINTLGAELISLNKDDFNYIWEVDENFWNKTSPVLFPIVGSLKNNEYYIDGNKYSLNRHGFARDCEFKLIEQKETSALFCLQSNEKTFKNFPFHFELFIDYEIKDSELIISYKVVNCSDVEMPFNIGAHPAFNLQYSTNEYSLEFNALESFKTHQLDNGLFTGYNEELKSNQNVLIISESYFEKDTLIFKNIESSSVKLKHLNKDYLKMSFNNFPHLGIWKKLKAPFLCIEPWTGYADYKNSTGNIFEKESIQVLKPNCFFECSIKIEI
jgi:galactose mutarotase-like enzyme